MQDQDVNPSEIISEGKNVDDAIAKALERLGVTRDQVECEVLEAGTQGVFGLIGVKQAKVVVRKKGADGDVSAKIEEMMNNLLRLMGMSGHVTVRLEDDIHRVDIETVGVDGLLIGKKGESLEDIGHLLRRMVGKQLKKSVRMDIDVGGYKRRRSGALKSKAISLASRVKATGKEMQMEPLSAAERRVVHLALADDPQIQTHTVGDGDLKNVVISSAHRGARNGGGGGQGERRPSEEPGQGHEHDGDEPMGGGAEGEAWSTGD
jgi:spoIIIJ-associated protein